MEIDYDDSDESEAELDLTRSLNMIELRGSNEENIRVQSDPVTVIENHKSQEHRAVIEKDDGNTIDVLCLYTVEALQSRCIALKGKDCYLPKKYLEYVDSMNKKCEFAIHQTVRITTVKFKK